MRRRQPQVFSLDMRVYEFTHTQTVSFSMTIYELTVTIDAAPANLNTPT